jgi:4-alpha-glucanotransferase
MKPSATRGSQLSRLRELAHLHGVASAYIDVQGRRKQSTAEGLLAVTRALGAPVKDLQGVPEALHERRRAVWRRLLEPVAVAWNGGPERLELRLPSNLAGMAVNCCLQLETGESRNWACKLASLPARQSASFGRERYVIKRLPLPGQLPCGYHRLTIELGGNSAAALIISAPMRAYDPGSESRKGKRGWGVFLPLYALFSERSWGSGDFSDLEKLLSWTAELGGTAVATLPLLATFLTRPFDPSPYAPASRLFWSEFFLDLTRIPELEHCEAARELLQCTEVQNELSSLRETRLVDYRHGMALKRRILEKLAGFFFHSIAHETGARRTSQRRNKNHQQESRRQAFRAFLDRCPLAQDYARFRAVGESERSPWPLWPQSQRDGGIQEGAYDEQAMRYHLYVQWLAQEQIESLSRNARARGSGLCLDLPLGLHSAGYDVWRWPKTFVREISAGAPPDTFFTKGQVWSFPPLHPEVLREQGYRYFIDCLRHQLRHASILRIDHVMGFHRLFWIPDGFEARDGAYVRYRAEEFYAICSLESHRHKSWIVGENLGTVPPEVNPALARHNLKGMYVMQYELAPRRKLRAASSRTVASLNTHDTPLFAGFWQGLDIEDQHQLGLVTAAGRETGLKIRERQKGTLLRTLRAEGRLKNSAQSLGSVLRASLEWLSAGPACFVLFNLEDLWLETQPQNVPGTGNERPNWRRKASYSLEAFGRMREVVGTLSTLNKWRHKYPHRYSR